VEDFDVQTVRRRDAASPPRTAGGFQFQGELIFCVVLHTRQGPKRARNVLTIHVSLIILVSCSGRPSLERHSAASIDETEQREAHDEASRTARNTLVDRCCVRGHVPPPSPGPLRQKFAYDGSMTQAGTAYSEPVKIGG